MCLCAHVLGHVQLCNHLDCSSPSSSVQGILQQEYWSGLPFPTPRDLPNPGIEATSLLFPALAGEFFTILPPGKPIYKYTTLYMTIQGFPDISVVKNLPAMQETEAMWVWSMGWEDPLEENAAHFFILAWKITWTEEPGGLSYKGSQRVGCNWAHTWLYT